LQFLDRVIAEVIVLPGHRTKAAHLPEQPLDRLGAAAQVVADEFAGLVGEIEQNGAGLEHRDRCAAAGRIVVDDGWDAVVRRHRQELRLELLTLADIDRDELVRQSGFFEENRDFVAVRRGPVMYVDHDKPLGDDGGEAPSLAIT
jgi:hypothetical protein